MFFDDIPEENINVPEEKDERAGFSAEEKSSLADEAKWYVIHTYSGYENKVKANLEKIVENRNMQDYIVDIVVPMEKHQEVKDGKTKITFKKIYPVIICYIVNCTVAEREKRFFIELSRKVLYNENR
jgi:transcription antitermination factor NusG